MTRFRFTGLIRTGSDGYTLGHDYYSILRIKFLSNYLFNSETQSHDGQLPVSVTWVLYGSRLIILRDSKANIIFRSLEYGAVTYPWSSRMVERGRIFRRYGRTSSISNGRRDTGIPRFATVLTMVSDNRSGFLIVITKMTIQTSEINATIFWAN